MVESKFYSGTDLQGEEIQKASRNDRNLIWMDAPRATVFGEILDYTCKHAPAGLSPRSRSARNGGPRRFFAGNQRGDDQSWNRYCKEIRKD